MIGLSTIVLARRTRYVGAGALGCAHCGLCVLFVALVNALNWGPSRASIPFTLMGLAYMIAALPACVYIWRHPPAHKPPWVCADCGYLLFGLTEPRCPECGRAFDPKRVAESSPPDMELDSS